MNDEYGPRVRSPLLGGLLGGLRPRATGSSRSEDSRIGERGARVPTDPQIASLIQDGLLVLPRRYFVGFFLDLLI